MQVRSAIAANEVRLDVNDNGYFDAIDGAVIARHLLGFRGDALLPGGAASAGVDAKRTTGAAMQTYIDAGCPVVAIKKWSEHFPTTGGVFISVLDHVELDHGAWWQVSVWHTVCAFHQKARGHVNGHKPH